MKRIRSMVLLLVIALSLLLPAAVTAAPDLGTNATTDVVRMLEIRAPEVARVGQTVRMQVVERYSQRPVPLAYVWAIPANIPTPELTDYQESAAFAASSGYYLGRTDREGMIYHKFDRPNHYMLLSLKWGYVPGIAKIEIKPALKTLEIRAPEVARVGQTVRMQVVERYSQRPVPLAYVWAIPANIPTPELTDYQESAAFAASSGYYLGRTDREGMIYHKFDRPNHYMLLSLKWGYVPGIAKIEIKPALKTLEIRAPEVVRVQQRVPIQVLEKTVLTVIQPVPNAAVWALKLGDVPAAIEAEEYDSLVKRCGIFLGWTNERGYVDPSPTFQRAGEYLLVALKRGYLPGIDHIKVISPAITVTNVEEVSSKPSEVVRPASVFTIKNAIIR